MRRGKGYLEKGLVIGGLALAVLTGNYAIKFSEEETRKSFNRYISSPSAINVGFENEAISQDRPIYAEGVQDCGVCVLFGQEDSIGVTHHGFKYIYNIGREMDMSYLEDLVNYMGGAKSIRESMVFGGDFRYANQIINELNRLGISISGKYIDGIRADGEPTEDSAKTILVTTGDGIYLKKGKGIKRIKTD